jgi:two-component sensor histidine kinase
MRVLIVDECGTHRGQIKRLLQAALDPVEWIEAGDSETYAEAMDEAHIDLVLTEAVLGWTTGLAVLQDVRARMPGVPVVMVTGSGSETLAVDGLKAGLEDYVPMDHLERLVPAIVNAVERTSLEHALQQTRHQLAAELEIMRRIQEVSTRLLQADEIDALYREILDTTLAILHADFGSIQMLRPERGDSGELQLIEQRGINQKAAQVWEWVGPYCSTTCAIALRTRKRVIVPDIEACEVMAGSQDQAIYLQSGIRAVQSTPLFSRSGQLLGILSTHWARPCEATASELRALDILARLAADLIQRRQADERLRSYMVELEHLNEANHLLLGEVNHRVKNSLTAILGLIFAEQQRLKADSPVNGGLPRGQIALEDLSKRVRNLATVHELLASGEWRPLRADLLVGELIRASLPADVDPRRLRLTLTGEPVLLSPQQAHHLALVVGELAMNTAKHRDSQETLHITVDLKLEDGEVRLTYRSHDSSYPDRVLDGKDHSVGLGLVRTLTTHSLRGTWAIRNDEGAVTEIRFPISNPTFNGWRTGQHH